MRSSTRTDYERRMGDLLGWMLENLDAPLDLSGLASVANLSPFHFHRVFRAMLRESAIDLVRRVRLERAAYRLGNAAQPITEIAFEAGYATHEAFIRAFRAAFGMNPSDYRKHPIGIGWLPCPNGIHYMSPVGEVRFAHEGINMKIETRALPSQTVLSLPQPSSPGRILEDRAVLRPSDRLAQRAPRRSRSLRGHLALRSGRHPGG